MPSDDTQGEPGHLGTLTPQEERKLQEAWVHILRLSGFEGSEKHPAPDRTAEHREELGPDAAAAFRPAFWNLPLGDHPDVNVLRFMRARRWDVDKAMAMALSNMRWRHELRIDDEIVAKGDSIALGKLESKHDKEYMQQWESGKAYVRGEDKFGRPVFVIKVAKHLVSGQDTDVMDAFVLHNIETIRTMIRHPHEKACLIFDLTGFGLKNMDFHVVKFLAQTFEARYPECLGIVLVHNAPFIFWGELTPSSPSSYSPRRPPFLISYLYRPNA